MNSDSSYKSGACVQEELILLRGENERMKKELESLKILVWDPFV
jgi:hypothetical protein